MPPDIDDIEKCGTSILICVRWKDTQPGSPGVQFFLANSVRAPCRRPCCDGAFRWITPSGWGGRNLVRPGSSGCGGAFTEITPELPPDPDSRSGSIPTGSADAGLDRSADARSIQQPNAKNDLRFI